MAKIVESLLLENLKSLKPYESARRLFSGGRVFLNANESPFANDFELDSSKFNRYPDCQPPAVIQSYAEYAGVQQNQVLNTRGADEGIELLIRAFCQPGRDRILICPPTYGMYAISAETCNVGVEKAPLNDDFSLDVDEVCRFKGKVNLVFICSPNNPTGTSVNATEIQRVVEHFADSALVVVDEAYIEFDPDTSWSQSINQYENLVVLRTLSKAFALAGLRCGFTLANQDIIQALFKVIAPYPVPEPVAQIAAQALSKKGVAKMREQVSFLEEQKQRFKDALTAFPGIELVGDDKANFILFRLAQKQELMDYLVEKGVLIRDQSKQLGLNNCLRITLGSEQENSLLLALIASFFEQQELIA